MPPLSILIKPASGNCNMQCDYCFYCDEMDNRKVKSYGVMSDQTLKNVIRRTMLKADNYISYAFQGGEPTLRGLDYFRKVIAYQKQYNKKNLRVSNALQTNGYCINEEWCEFFHDNDFLIGVSVDGTRKIHDSLRFSRADKSPTYDKILENIHLMEKHKVEFNILTVITNQVAMNIKEIYHEYMSNGWYYQQYIECLDPLEGERGNQSYSLTPELYGKFLVDLFELWYKDWRKGRQPYIRKFENYISILAGYMPESCEQRGICGIQTVVEADGSVYPCDFYMLDEYCLGNFNYNRLDEINQKRKEIGFIEKSRNISNKCNACKYYGICRGGCKRSRVEDKTTEGYYNYFCKSYQMFFEQCLDRMIEIANTLRSR